MPLAPGRCAACSSPPVTGSGYAGTGVCWAAICLLPPGGNETALAQRPDGAVVLHARSPGRRLSAISTDGGATFSPWREEPALPDPSTSGDLLAVGDLLIASHCADPHLRRNLVLSTSTDGGNTWRRGPHLDTGSA